MSNRSYQEYWKDVYKNKVKFASNGDGSIIPWEIKSYDKNLKDILDYYNLKKGEALELGCGEGYDSAFLSSIGFKVTAIDISEDVIQKAKIVHNNSNVDFLSLDFFEAVPNKKFDLIFDRGFLHNYKSRSKEIFEKLDQITKENSKLIFITGNPNSPILKTCMPPPVTLSEIEFFSMHWFKIISVKEIEFQVNDNYQSSLGYIFLLEKRSCPLNY